MNPFDLIAPSKATEEPAVITASPGTDILDFPPLYTIQRAERTKAKQLEIWRNLILDRALVRGGKEFVTIDISKFPLFANDKIGRSLSLEGRKEIGDSLVREGNAEWEDPSTKNLLRVSVRSAGAWGSLIYDWARDTGRLGGGSITTLYEIHSGDDAAAGLSGLHPELVYDALKTLEKAGKAQLIPGTTVDETGIKFW